MQWIVAILVGVALLLIFAVVGGGQVMHPPRPRQRPVPDGGEAVTFQATDGVTLRGWFFPVERAKGTIVYGPGRGQGLNGFDFRYIPLFNRNGYSLLMFDPRGLGDSNGVSSMGAVEWRDFLGAVEYLRTRGISSVGFCGPSQGAATAIMAAARCPEALAVVAECPYASWETTLYHGLQAYAHVPAPLALPGSWLIARWLEFRLGFRAADAEPVRVIGRIAPRPVLLIHGPHDQYIPMSEMERLYAAAGEPKELWMIPEAGHTQGLTLQPEEYERRVIAFFDKWLAGAKKPGGGNGSPDRSG